MDFTLTKKDILQGKQYLKREQIDPKQENQLFLASIYSVLSPGVTYTHLINTYNRFLDNKLDAPNSMLNNKDKVKKVASTIGFGDKKGEYIIGLSEWWAEGDLEKKIIRDIRTGRKNEFEIRNFIAKNAPGLGYKCASLTMMKCGYKNIGIIDKWMIRLLDTLGHDTNLVDNNGRAGKNSPYEGLSKSTYLKYENIISDLAKHQDISPVMFQSSIWIKNSRSRKKASEK